MCCQRSKIHSLSTVAFSVESYSLQAYTAGLGGGGGGGGDLQVQPNVFFFFAIYP